MDNENLQDKIDKYTKPDKERNGMGIASMVLGIVALSLLPFLGCLSFVIVPLALVGFIMGIIALNKKDRVKGQAIAGVIVSGLVLFFMIAFNVIALLAGGSMNAVRKSSDKQWCETIDSAMTTAAMDPKVATSGDFNISSMSDGKEHRISELPSSVYRSEVFDILGVYSVSDIEGQLSSGDEIYFTVDGQKITVYCYKNGKEKPMYVSD